MMRSVLLSNDDGVHAPGLRALAEAFLADGWRVTVAAPDRERSAASHGITIKQHLTVQREQYSGVSEDAPLVVWAVDGLPADCVKLALHELCGERPDVVVSGVNNGWNVGTDVHYSGTVAAATEAAYEGMQAVAVSTFRTTEMHRYAYAAGVAAKMAARLVENPLPAATILNLNLPDCEPEAVQGLVEAPMSLIRYSDRYEKKPCPGKEGEYAYQIVGDIIEEGNTPGGDLDRLMKGYATVTVLGWDLSRPGMGGLFLQDGI